MQVVGANSGGVAYSKAHVIPWQKRIQSGSYKQKGGGWFDSMSEGMFGFKQTRGKKRKKPAAKQKGGGWFDSMSEGMFGFKQTRGRKKRKPAVIHSASRRQKGGGNPRNPFKGFFDNPLGIRQKLGRKKRKQKGGVLGLEKLAGAYNGQSKKEQRAIDAWVVKNL